MTMARPVIADTTMTAIFHGSIRFTAVSIRVNICIGEENTDKLLETQ